LTGVHQQRQMKAGARGKTADPAGPYVPSTGHPVRKLPPRFANRAVAVNNAASRNSQGSQTNDRTSAQPTPGLMIIDVTNTADHCNVYIIF